VLINKYELYEQSVQSPDTHIDWFAAMFQEIRGSTALALREDFCGTFRLSCEWVKRNPKHRAVSVDLDPEPLTYGKKHHWKGMSLHEKKRLKPVLGDVIRVKTPGQDLIIACNFSFFIFKDRKVLLDYFKNAIKSLSSQGLLILEMAGGPGMIATMREKRTVRLKKARKFTYIWDQKSFDPITRNGHYSIHFKFANGQILRDLFTYDWRLWTIPEVRELLAEAGFKKSYVYWETSHKGKGTGEFVQMENGDNAYAWIAYIVAAR
jgi:hypothetical protein